MPTLWVGIWNVKRCKRGVFASHTHTSLYILHIWSNMHFLTTHGTTHIVLITRRIILFILFGMCSPASPAKLMFAFINNHRGFMFCTISMHACFYPRRSTLAPMIHIHIFVTYRTFFAFGWRRHQFPNRGESCPSINQRAYSAFLGKRKWNGLP